MFLPKRVHRQESQERGRRNPLLDESAIEAQAIKILASELEILDKRLMSLEARRNRAIRNIAEYRESFGRKVREGSGRIIEGDSVIRLENPSGQKSA